MKFDPTKPVRTKRGRPARIICTDRKGDRPYIALIDNGEVEHLCTVGVDGSTFFEEHCLENIPERRSVFRYIVQHKYCLWTYAIDDGWGKRNATGRVEFIMEGNEVIDVKYHKGVE